MLHLAALARAHLADPDIHVVTVDHGLRAGAADEARAVARLCGVYGLPHQTLHWQGDKRVGNLSAAAREARYDLLGQAAWNLKAETVVTAHHLDDQIETHLLADARGGRGRALAGMRPVRALRPGVVVARPFLGIAGARLRATLRQAGIEWCEDPTNRDMHYARARLRAALQGGELDGAAALAALEHAGRERAEHDCNVLAAISATGVTVDDGGTIQLDMTALAALEPDVRRALLARAVTAAGGTLYPPPAEKLDRLSQGFHAEAGNATLGGACFRWRDGRAMIHREYGRAGIAVDPATPDRLWFDRRFVISGEASGTIVALGALGRGNAVERCLPVRVSQTGEVLARHASIRPWANGPAQLLNARESVSWRLMADL